MEHVRKKLGKCVYLELPSISVAYSRSPLPRTLMLKRLVQECDVVYFNNAYFLQDMLMSLVKLTTGGRPVVSSFQAPLFINALHDLYVRFVTRNVSKFFDACHVLTAEMKQQLEKWGLRNIYVIPGGVDVERFAPQALRRTGSFSILFVGRLSVTKGFDRLYRGIDALNKFPLGEKLRFCIVGDGELSMLARELAWKYSNVRYLGYVPGDLMPSLYNSCDILLVPSRQETLSLAILEAHACGLPCIASAVQGPKSLVIPRETGFLIPPEGTLPLVQAIQESFRVWSQQPSMYQYMRRKSRESAQAYDWRRLVPEFQSMFLEVSRK
jgi:glycosyltransferase involved in cell wall biosynthesis